MRAPALAAVVVVLLAAAFAGGGCDAFDDELEPNDAVEDATLVERSGFDPMSGMAVAGNDDFFTLGEGERSRPVRWHFEVTGGDGGAALLVPGADRIACADPGAPPPRLLCGDDGTFDLDGVHDVVIVRQPPCDFCLHGGRSTYELAAQFLPSP